MFFSPVCALMYGQPESSEKLKFCTRKHLSHQRCIYLIYSKKNSNLLYSITIYNLNNIYCKTSLIRYHKKFKTKQKLTYKT